MFASRLKDIEISDIRKLFEMANKHTINLGIGEPDFQPPTHVINAFKDAVDRGYNKYASSSGLSDLRDIIAKKCTFGLSSYSRENVLITTGSAEGLIVAMHTFINRGDEVLCPDPGFVLYVPQVKLAEGKPIFYQLYQENNFRPTQEDILNKITKKTKMIIVNSPSNPTGGIFTKEDVKMIKDIAEDKNLIIVSDEVYHSMIYDAQHYTFLDYEKCIHINSFSKTYALTGWRIGFIIANEEYIKELLKYHYYTIACAPTPTQYACISALNGSQKFVKEMVKEFKRRRDFIYEEVKNIESFDCIKPEGAFYIFPKYKQRISSWNLALRLVKHGVICVNGSSFGKNGEGHLRFSYANPIEKLKDGIERVKKCLNEVF